MPYTYKEIGQRAKRKNPDLFRYGDEELGRKLAAENPKVAALVSPDETMGILEKIGTGLGQAALAPVRAATGALKLGQQAGQMGLKALGARVPERDESVLSDVFLHGGEIGTEMLQAQKQKFGTAGKVGAGIGDVGFTIAASAPYGQAAGTQAAQAVRQGLVKPALKFGAKSGLQAGIPGGFAAGVIQGQEPLDVAKSMAIGGAAGAAGGAALFGTAAGAVKGYQAAKPYVQKGVQKAGETGRKYIDRFQASRAQKAAQEAQNRARLYGAIDDTGKSVAGQVDDTGRAVMGQIDDTGKMLSGKLDDISAKLTPKQVKAIDAFDFSGGLPGDAEIVRTADDKSRSVMRKMFDLAKRNMGSRSPEQRPVQLAGKEVMRLADKLDDFRAAAGQQMDDAAKPILGKVVNTDDAANWLLGFLDDNAVQYTDDGLNFSRSTFRGNAALQKELGNLVDDLTSGNMTVRETIAAQRRLDTLLRAAREGKMPMGPFEGGASQLRKLLNRSITSVSDDYAKAASDYSVAKRGLEGLYRKVGKQYVDGFKPSSDLKVGEVFHRVEGKASSEYISILDEMDDALKHFGYDPDIDLRALFRFDDALEDIFGATQTGGLRGQVTGAIKDLPRSKAGLIRAGLGKAEQALGATKEAQIQAMDDLLKSFQNPLGSGPKLYSKTQMGLMDELSGSFAKEADDLDRMLSKKVITERMTEAVRNNNLEEAEFYRSMLKR